MGRITTRGIIRVLCRSVAPFLLLITPFATFMEHQSYSMLRPEAMVVVFALAALSLLLGVGAALSPAFEVATIAGLLTLLADIQLEEPGAKALVLLFIVLCAIWWGLRQHAARIVSLMMATVLVLSTLSPRPVAASLGRPAVPSRRDLPLILHLVLDEHIGVEGLPADLAPRTFKSELKSFFVDRGFRLFGSAYSEYPTTVLSLSHLLNLAPGGYVPELASPGTRDDRYRLTRNVYFDRLAGQGYAIRVHQPDYLDICTQSVPASACDTYRAKSLDAVDRLPLPWSEKTSVVAGAYVMQAESYMRLKNLYRLVWRRVNEAGITLPSWDWERGNAAPLGTMPVFDTLANDLSKAQGGDFVFAHLLMPHYPYVYDTECQPRPPREWLIRSDPNHVDLAGGITNTPNGRAARYALYFQQITCVQKKIDQLLHAIPPSLRHDAIILIQGDHGSRISLADPIVTGRDRLAESDYADHFSTLFAVRSAQLEAGYDVRRSPITCLLRTLVEQDFRSVVGLETCSVQNVVFFQDGKKPHVLPAFSRETGGPDTLSTARQ